MSDATLTTTQPGQPPRTRPVPPSWATIAPLLERWHIALVPHPDGTWDVLACHHRHKGLHAARLLLFHDIPQAVIEVAAQCEAASMRAEMPRSDPLETKAAQKG